MVAANARTAIAFALLPGNAHDAPERRELLNKKRNEIERLFRRLKGFRRIVSRFEKLDVLFTGFLNFALIVEALR
jgi:transposase